MKEEELKKALSGLLKDAKEKKALEDETRKAKNEEDRRNIFESVGKDIGQVVGPYIEALNARDEKSHQNMGDTLKRIITESIKIDAPSVDTQGIQDVLTGAFANLKIPEPIVNYTPPAITVPEIKMPESMMVDGEVGIKGVTKKNPFPVMMMGPDGKPMTFSQAVGMGGGGNFPMQVLDAANNALRVSGSFSITASNASTQAIDSSGNAYSQANPMPVTVVSGSAATTGSALVDSSGVQYSGSNPVPVTITSGALSTSASVISSADGNSYVALINNGDGDVSRLGIVTDSRTRGFNGSTWDRLMNTSGEGNALRIQSATDAVMSVNIVSGSSSGAIGQGDSASATRIIQAGDSVSSVIVNSGTITTVTTVGSITNSLSVSLADSSGVGYSGSNPVPITGTVIQGSNAGLGSAWAVKLTDGASNLIGVNQGDTTVNTLRVIHAGDAAVSVNIVSGSSAGATGPGDSASALRTLLAGDAVASFNLLQINGTTPATGLNETNVGVLRTVMMTDSVVSVNIVSGSSSGVTGPGEQATALRVLIAGDAVSSINLLQINGSTPATGLNETNGGVLRTVLMTDAVSSTNLATALDHTIDSIAVRQVSGFIDSIYITGVVDSTIVTMARTTNPTAVSDGSDVRPTADKLGRSLNRPIQVRELIATAYATVSTGTETTLLAATAGQYIDLICVMCANTSSAAQQIDIRAGTGGNIVQTIYIPPNSTAGWAPSVPWPQDATGNTWTVDNADVTNSTVYVSALFSKEL